MLSKRVTDEDGMEGKTATTCREEGLYILDISRGDANGRVIDGCILVRQGHHHGFPDGDWLGREFKLCCVFPSANGGATWVIVKGGELDPFVPGGKVQLHGGVQSCCPCPETGGKKLKA
jgi:hypothetical protein